MMSFFFHCNSPSLNYNCILSVYTYFTVKGQRIKKKCMVLRVFQMGLTCVGEKFGQNGQKLHENYKTNILGAKQWGDKPIFWVVGESPTRGNPDCLACKYSKTPSDFFSSAMLMCTVAQM